MSAVVSARAIDECSRMKRPEVVIVAAHSRNRVIGRDGQMAWHCPEDLQYFRQLTMGKVVVMGRRTFESLGKPLKGRFNIVVTREQGWSALGAETACSLDDAISSAACTYGAREVMIIGGGQVYEQALAVADRLELSEIPLDVEGDVYFPVVDDSQWVTSRRQERGSFSTTTWVRRKPT